MRTLETHLQSRVLPSPLYGRDTELSQLQNLLTRSTLAIGQVFMLRGVAGSGKTALLEWTRHHAEATVFFAKGELHEAKSPFNIIKKMLRAWTLTLRESPTLETAWRKRLLENLGSDVHLLTTVFPDLAHFLQIPIAPLESKRHEPRRDQLSDVVLGLFNVVLKHAQPLILIFDDLQWSDKQTLQVLEGLAKLHVRTRLTVVGAFRAEDETADLRRTLHALAAVAGAYAQIDVPPLTLAAIEQMVQASTDTPAVRVRQTSEMLLSYTEGNAFAVEAMLRHRAHAIDAAAMLAPDPHLLQLWREKLSAVESVSWEVLATGACLGRVIITSLVQKLSGPMVNVGLVLEGLAEQGFVTREGTIWRFVHDSVHEAIYATLTADQKSTLHWQIAHAFVGDAQADSFSTARHVNAAGSVAVEHIGATGVARVNYAAAQAAKDAGALLMAAEYLATARVYLRDAGEAAFSQACMVEEAVCSGMGGDLPRARSLFAEVTQAASGTLEKAELSAKWVEALAINDSMHDAVEAMRQGLRMLQVAVPSDPSKLAVWLQVRRAESALAGRTVFDVLALPEVEDQIVLAQMRLLLSGLLPSYFHSKTLFAWIFANLSRLTFLYGNSRYSAFSLLGHAMLQVAVRKRYRAACAFARAASEVA